MIFSLQLQRYDESQPEGELYCVSNNLLRPTLIYGFYTDLVHAIGGNGRAVTVLATPLILDANNNTGSTFEFTKTTLVSNGYWFGDTWISIVTHALCSPTSRAIPESALYEFDEHVTQLLGFGNTVSTFSIILYDFETSVAQTASAAVWAVLIMSGYSTNSTAETSLLISTYSLHLNENVTPASVGLLTSIILLVFSVLIYSSGSWKTAHCRILWDLASGMDF